MDFIERSLGFAPDNGSGSVEFLLLSIACLCVACVVTRRRRTPHSRLESGT